MLQLNELFSITRQCEMEADDSDSTVVAVLGMAHLNGVKRLIEDRAEAEAPVA